MCHTKCALRRKLHAGAVFAALLLLINAPARAQQAQVSGSVVDSSRAAIPNARVEILQTATRAKWTIETNDQGIFVAPSVPAGDYEVSATAKGFESKRLEHVHVEVAAKVTLDFVLNVGTEAQAITVDASGVQVNTSDAAVSTVIDEKFVRNLPLNGRSFQSLLTLIPGVITVPSTGAGSSGQISVNGMRAESNYFTVDGVSANTGVNTSSPGRGAGYSGSLPSGTALGTTQSLISVDALQEFRGTTSTYSAEYGRGPGGQFSFITRSGTNAYHGSLYEYFRNDVLDANSFFNNRSGLGRTKMRQNDFGGTLGGRVWIPKLYDGKNKTFFFVSWESLRLRAPQQATITSVPTAALRNTIAPPELRPYLQAFPLPTPGYAEEPGFTAPFVGSYSQPSSIDSTSIRLDHMISDRFQIFGRLSFVPSSTIGRYSSNLAQVTDAQQNTKMLTLGGTNMLTSATTNEARFNVSWTDQLTSVTIDDFGGAIPLRISQFPGLSETDWALFSYRVNTFPGFWLNPANNRQKQFNIVDNLTTVKGRHTLKAGVDWRWTRTDSTLPRFYQTPFYYTTDQLLNNSPQLFTAYRSTGDMAPVYKNLSAFLQDEWKVNDRLTVSLGLRWEWSPAPMDANGNQPFTVDQISNLATTKIAPKGSQLWNTRWNNFAPRVGFAYRLHGSNRYATVVRAGAGMFHDTSSAQGSEGYWYGLGVTGTLNLNNQPFPLSAAALENTPLPSAVLTSSSLAQIFAFDPNLKMPYAIQWNTTIEQQLGASHVLSVGYVASLGDRLLLARQLYPERLNNPAFPVGSAYLYATLNGSSSSYHSMQVQFRRQFAQGLQFLNSYTWSHAIDDATSNFTINTLLRASSSYDIRHNLQSAVSYQVPGKWDQPVLKALLSGWGTDYRLSARSALPVDVTASNVITAGGLQYSPHPNVDTTKPLYVTVENAPGQRAINRDAFTIAPNGAEGNSGRNIARGFGSVQSDLALRREFAFTERVGLTFRAEAFNVLNQVNLGAISSNIQTGTAARPFGYATNTQASQFGGLNPLYQIGGPRSIQFALRLRF